MKKTLLTTRFTNDVYQLLIKTCVDDLKKSGIIGQNTSTETIENLSLNQIWNIILGVDFGNKSMKKMKLNELTDMKKNVFKKFYRDFELVAKDFCDNSYINTDPLINRRFSIAGSYLFWVPLNDLPGCKIEK